MGCRYTLALLFILVLVCLWQHASHAQETASGDHVQIRWLAPETFARGKTEHIGFYFEVDPEWHVYWRNAGDSGAAPKFDILSEEADVGSIQWPFPKRLPIAHLTNLGYEGDVAYLLPVTPTSDSPLSLTVNLEWLVCKVDCIPGFGQMSLTRPVGNTANWNSGDLALRDRFLAQVPGPELSSSWSALDLRPLGETQLQLTLNITREADQLPDLLPQVFPLNGDLVGAAEPDVLQTEEGLLYTFARAPGAALESTSFVVSDGKKAWRLEDVPISPAIFPDVAQTAAQPLWFLLLAAFVGGIILNLMPCVFPVLSIKLFGLVQTDTPRRVHEAFAYTAGILATFAALGGLLLALRASGSAIGWGFQLQSAPVILALIILFWLMALSFSGVFEFGNRLVTLAGSNRGGAFVTGMLAVFVATPCTGPFMGVALGAASVLPAVSAMAVFLGLGAGLAAPFVLLSLSPALLRLLPKPGRWMDTLRQLLAFPLYATVIWLLWVLGQLIGDTGWLIGCLLMLTLVFSLWLSRTMRRYGTLAASAVAVAALVLSFSSLRVPEAEPLLDTAGRWQPFDPELIEQARAQGQPVFIDYTAAWCITCQVNKKLVLDTKPVMELFAHHDVLLVRADWTHHDPAITESLAQLGRNSVPVYAWYAQGASQAEILPQLLQARMVEGLLN